MKKNKFLIPAAALILLVGAYFLFFQNSNGEATENGKNDSIQAAVSSSPAQPDMEQNAKDEMHRLKLMAEHTRPSEFLNVSIDPKKNVFGESVIEGIITNKAELTTYKEFELMIYWNDEKGMLLDSAAEIIFESVEPGKTAAFKTKRKGPRKGKSIMMSIRDAKIIER